MIKQSKLLKIKNKILLNALTEKYELKLREFNTTTGTERVKIKLVNTFKMKNFINFVQKLNLETIVRYFSTTLIKSKQTFREQNSLENCL